MERYGTTKDFNIWIGLIQSLGTWQWISGLQNYLIKYFFNVSEMLLVTKSTNITTLNLGEPITYSQWRAGYPIPGQTLGCYWFSPASNYDALCEWFSSDDVDRMYLCES